jgi:hypothetical protein
VKKRYLTLSPDRLLPSNFTTSNQGCQGRCAKSRELSSSYSPPGVFKSSPESPRNISPPHLLCRNQAATASAYLDPPAHLPQFRKPPDILVTKRGKTHPSPSTLTASQQLHLHRHTHRFRHQLGLWTHLPPRAGGRSPRQIAIFPCFRWKHTIKQGRVCAPTILPTALN